MRSRPCVILLLVSLVAFVASARADSLQLYYSSNGTYYYELTLTQYPTHYAGDFLKVTGFSGVTEADLAYQLAQFNFASLSLTDQLRHRQLTKPLHLFSGLRLWHLQHSVRRTESWTRKLYDYR